MPKNPDNDGWVNFKVGERLILDEATDELRIVFSWQDWLKHWIWLYLVPFWNDIRFSQEFYDLDREWCETLLSYNYLPFAIAEWATRWKLGRWEKQGNHD